MTSARHPWNMWLSTKQGMMFMIATRSILISIAIFSQILVLFEAVQ
jgi:hypothetical protein